MTADRKMDVIRDAHGSAQSRASNVLDWRVLSQQQSSKGNHH